MAVEGNLLQRVADHRQCIASHLFSVLSLGVQMAGRPVSNGNHTGAVWQLCNFIMASLAFDDRGNNRLH